MNRYRPARQYLPASVAASALAAFSIWCGLHWSLALIPAGLFVLSACLLYFLGARPVIEVTRACLYIGVRSIRWSEIESVESTAWNSPLVLHLTLRGGKRARLIYPGDVASADRLLRQVRRLATMAKIDGVPHAEFWGEAAPIRAEAKRLSAPTIRLLRTEDEEEVERLYRQLRAVGRLDASADEPES